MSVLSCLVSHFAAGGYAPAPTVLLAAMEMVRMRLDRLEGKPDGRRGLGQRYRRADAAAFRHPLHQPQSRRELSRLSRQPRQSSRQRKSRHHPVPARGPFGLDRARLCQGDRRADGLRAALQCRPPARHDEPVQRLVRPRAACSFSAPPGRLPPRNAGPGSIGFTPRATRAPTSAPSSNGTTSRPPPTRWWNR